MQLSYFGRRPRKLLHRRSNEFQHYSTIPINSIGLGLKAFMSDCVFSFFKQGVCAYRGKWDSGNFLFLVLACIRTSQKVVSHNLQTENNEFSPHSHFSTSAFQLQEYGTGNLLWEGGKGIELPPTGQWIFILHRRSRKGCFILLPNFISDQHGSWNNIS